MEIECLKLYHFFVSLNNSYALMNVKCFHIWKLKHLTLTNKYELEIKSSSEHWAFSYL